MKILLGVSGGIAAYKAAELVRALQEQAVEVQVGMTQSAQEFVKPLTFAALTGKKVYTSLWDSAEEDADGSHDFEIEHIAVAQVIDALVIAPATANILAKFASGIADDFFSTLYLATAAPVLVAPAMNVVMWQHPATQENVRKLRERGVRVVEPGEGYLACGMTGSGRLAAIETITAEVLALLQPRCDLVGETILVTAGGTREPIDPVRFLGNRSSGKMGHALAAAAVARGGRVTLVTASSLSDPVGCKVVRVSTADEMQRAVLGELAEATVVIKAAAVADFRARTVAPQKLRRDGGLTLELEPTEDIVAKIVAEKRDGTIVIAFAAESENVEANARAKLVRKGADAIVANDISSPEFGFDSDRNAGVFLTSNRAVNLRPGSKAMMAERILDEVIVLRQTVALPESLAEHQRDIAIGT
jgi:phosphopantothenoylcysteine decarboxylase/phosphopantothenate--cysteine ligase